MGSIHYCIENRISGHCDCNSEPTSACITPALWQSDFTAPFPAACAAQGAPCIGGGDGGTITAYCCPGLTCIGLGGSACGSPPGTCQP